MKSVFFLIQFFLCSALCSLTNEFPFIHPALFTLKLITDIDCDDYFHLEPDGSWRILCRRDASVFELDQVSVQAQGFRLK